MVASLRPNIWLPWPWLGAKGPRACIERLAGWLYQDHLCYSQSLRILWVSWDCSSSRQRAVFMAFLLDMLDFNGHKLCALWSQRMKDFLNWTGLWRFKDKKDTNYTLICVLYIMIIMHVYKFKLLSQHLFATFRMWLPVVLTWRVWLWSSTMTHPRMPRSTSPTLLSCWTFRLKWCKFKVSRWKTNEQSPVARSRRPQTLGKDT